MKKGFTLIELLAVIVILAIIALIASPIIIGLIDDARKEAFKSSAYGIVKSGEILFSKDLLKGTTEEVIFTYNNGVETSSVSEKELDYNGTKPKTGSVSINGEGKIAVAIHNGNYCAKKGYYDSEVILTEEALGDCNIPLYADNTGASIPELTVGMIPVVYNGTNWIKANVIDKWYDYNKQEWANVVLVTEGTRDDYKTALSGTTINENDVLAYLVWVPRYRYKLFNVDALSFSPQTIEIVFEDKNTTKSNGSTNGTWLTHPAFWWDNNSNGTREEGEEISGIWVGKFETTGDATTPTVKPNVASLTGQNVSTQFATAQKFNNTATYGTTSDFDSHMMKSMEWGAVAYLSQSQYGKYGNSMYTGANKEIYQNKSSSSITGSSNGTPSQSTTNIQCTYNDTVDRGSGTGACGAGASTTGNIYGIYDMSGGADEYVMGAMYNDGNTTVMVKSSGFVQATIDSIDMEKYINKYTYGTTYIDQTAFNRRQLGDATGETRGWYSDSSGFVGTANPWFIRGGSYSSLSSSAGVFVFSNYTGAGSNSRSFRVVQLKP